METGSMWVLILLVGMAAVLAFVDAQRHSDVVWRRAGHSLLFWTLVIVLIPTFGPALYLLLVKPRLARAAAAT